MKQQKDNEHPNYASDKQGELFSEFEAPNAKKPGLFLRQDIALGKKIILKFSYENLVLFFIVFIMLLVVFFSLGVEKGKRIVSHREIARIDRAVDKVVKRPTKVEEGKSKTFITPVEIDIDKFKDVKLGTTIEKAADVPEKPYTIQVIAFKKEENAKKEVEQLKSKGYDVFMIPSSEWIQVCIGRYTNKEESKKDFDILKKKYPTCYLRKIE